MRITITIILCLLSFGLGTAFAPEKIVRQQIEVMHDVAVYELPNWQKIRQHKYVGQQIDYASAAIPASALLEQK